MQIRAGNPKDAVDTLNGYLEWIEQHGPDKTSRYKALHRKRQEIVLEALEKHRERYPELLERFQQMMEKSKAWLSPSL